MKVDKPIEKEDTHSDGVEETKSRKKKRKLSTFTM